MSMAVVEVGSAEALGVCIIGVDTSGVNDCWGDFVFQSADPGAAAMTTTSVLCSPLESWEASRAKREREGEGDEREE